MPRIYAPGPSGLRAHYESTDRLSQSANAAGKALANLALAGAIEGLFKIAGEFPGLKSNANFIKLRKQDAELGKSIEEQQEFFNELVRSYNRRIRRFPVSLVARRARLEMREPLPDPEMGDER